MFIFYHFELYGLFYIQCLTIKELIRIISTYLLKTKTTDLLNKKSSYNNIKS
jgi:hypothetical protein